MTKQDYEDLYVKRINEIEAELKDLPGYDGIQATYEFDETANAKEVVGFYVFNEKENALNQWLDNIKGLELTEQDKEVTRILKELYE